MSASIVPFEEKKAVVTAQQKKPALPPLSQVEMAQASALAATLIPSEERLSDIVSFGSDAQIALAQVSRTMLDNVRVNALNDVIQLSDGVLGQVHTLDLDDLSPAARRALIFLHESAADIRRRIENFFKGYQLVNSRLDRQEADIFAKEAESTQRYHAYAEMERATQAVMSDARIRAAAIRLFLDSEHGTAELVRRREAVQGEKSRAEIANRAIDLTVIDAADRYGKYLERVEMKAAALQNVILSAYQSSLTIRMMQDNENIIRQKLSDIRIDLLPQWRTLIAIAYNAYLQHGIAAFVKKLETAESEMRRKTADQLEMTANEVADLMTRPAFDPDAVRYYHQKLINSLETLKAASVEAKRIRDTAEASTQQMIAQLGDAAAQTYLRTP